MMLAPTFVIGVLSLLISNVECHGFVKNVNVNGVITNGSDPVWYYYAAASRPQTAGWDALNQDNGFVTPSAVGTSDINCHKAATAGKRYVDVKAGDIIAFQWNTWPESHKGPIINYIAPCDGDCTTISSTALRWSKISQSGLITASSATWATDVMMKDNFVSRTTIPAKLAPGNYVIRHEIIALHGAPIDNGAQLYPQCLNLRVSGSGTVKPIEGIPGTSLYTRNMPGILFNLYGSPTSYPFPGPALWTAAN